MPGFGKLTPNVADRTCWTEYGVRFGYKLQAAITLDVFGNGVSGGDAIDSRMHVGAGLRFAF